MSNFIKKQACPACQEKGNDNHGDNLAVYDDGHAYCNKCSIRYAAVEMNMKEVTKWKKEREFIGEYKKLPERGLSKEICELLGIMEGVLENQHAYAYLFNSGVKCRLDNKDFPWIEGSPKECLPFGLEKAKDFNKPIIITEGEFDTAACYEVGHQACSLFNGNNSVKMTLREDVKELLLQYSEIWIGVDNDEAGKKAKQELVDLFPKEKLRVINWSVFKDANEALLHIPNNECKDSLTWILKIKQDYFVTKWKPEGIIFGNELKIEDLKNEVVRTVGIPLPKLSESFGGFDYGCLYFILAGAGIGKSTFMTMLGNFYFQKPNFKIAWLMLEENSKIVAKRYLANKFSVPIGKLRRDSSLLTDEQWKTGFNEICTDRIVFPDKKMKKTISGILSYIEYLTKVQKYDMILLDHISYVIGRTSTGKDGERRSIDEFCYDWQDMCQEIGFIGIAVSHLSNSKDEKGWDQGQIPRLYSGRGSGSIAQIPDGVIGLSRDMTSEYNQSIMNVYNLKNRWGGKTGKMDSLIYYDSTGTLEVYNK